MFGVIKTLTDRDFGFIAVDGEDRDLFFHSNEVVDFSFKDFRVGDVVQCDIHSVSEERAPNDEVRNGEFRMPYDEQRIIMPTSTAEIELQREISSEIIVRLSRSPHDLYRLTPQQFEKVIAELYTIDGFKTEILGSYNNADGGVDFVAVKGIIGAVTLRMAIQCKRYKERKVRIQPIRELAGVLDRFGAHAGAFFTTSDFSKPAKQETASYFQNIGLVNFQGIVEQLKRAELLIGVTGFPREADRRDGVDPSMDDLHRLWRRTPTYSPVDLAPNEFVKNALAARVESPSKYRAAVNVKRA